MAMSKPEHFILNTDYATLANDSDTITCTVTIPATTIASGVTQNYTNTVAVGSSGAPMEYDINYSLSSRRWKDVSVQFVENTGLSTQYDGQINVFRDSATTAKVVVTIYNESAGTVTKNARTVTVTIRTYIPPFST